MSSLHTHPERPGMLPGQQQDEQRAALSVEVEAIRRPSIWGRLFILGGPCQSVCSALGFSSADLHCFGGAAATVTYSWHKRARTHLVFFKYTHADLTATAVLADGSFYVSSAFS